MKKTTIQIPEGYKIKELNTETGEVLFEPVLKDIKERIKTFEDACKELGIKPDDVLHSALERDIVSINAYSKLIVIARALNEGWEPNWNDSSEYKYYPWLQYKSGVGFSSSVYVFTCTDTCVGSRLCFKSRELAEYAAVQFNKEYYEFFTLNK